MLDSKQRPAVWLRDFETRGYVLSPPGVQFDTVERGTPDAYDTSAAGYDRSGHTFGDAFGPAERAAILEYLKTI